MPIFTYNCKIHGEFDIISTIKEMRNHESCPQCGKKSKKIIALGHGGVWRNDAEWVKREIKPFFAIDGYNIETIRDYKKFLTEHPNIKPKNGHPALPSSIGDIKKVPTQEERRKTMKKAAMEYLRKDKAITLTSQTSV